MALSLENADSPQELFVALWQLAKSWNVSATDQLNLHQSFRKSVFEYLSCDDHSSGVAAIKRRLAGQYGTAGKAKVISALLAIDDVFSSVHPRSVIRAAKKPVTVPAWLINISEFREHTGAYYISEEDQLRLVPRGPLIGSSRSAGASNAYKFFDLFSYLEVVPMCASLNDDRDVPVVHKVLGAEFSGPLGAFNSLVRGAERLVAVPLAEKINDISIEIHPHHSTNLIRFSSNAALGAPQRLHSAINNSGETDFAFAPEFVMSEADVEIFKSLLRHNPAECRLIFSGSGASKDLSELHLPWNQLEIVNKLGKRLWVQRKLWRADIDRERATDIVAPLTLQHRGNASEANSEGDEVVVCDVPDVGRCVVLICQDIMSNLARTVITRYQPDWVFVPILDPEIKVGGWVHQKLFELSKESQARFVVLTSTALPRADLTASYPRHCLLMVSPMKPEVSDPPDDGLSPARGFALHVVSTGSNPGVVAICWNDTDWDKTYVGGSAPASGK